MKWLSALLSILLLNSCSATSSHSVVDAQGSTGILGGQSVAPEETIGQTTVQLVTVTGASQHVNEDGEVQTTYRFNQCTGTLISNSVILTAAHCSLKNPQATYVYFSLTKAPDLREKLEHYGNDPLFRQIVGGIVPKAWAQFVIGQGKDWGDIALLKFAGGLPAPYKPALLLNDYESVSAIQTLDTGRVFLAGFGWINKEGESPSVLQSVDVTVSDLNYSPTEFVFGTNDGRGACHGDSGGPAYIQWGLNNYLVGVTSRASAKDPRGECNDGSIYTKLSSYKDWIHEGQAKLEDPAFITQEIPQPF